MKRLWMAVVLAGCAGAVDDKETTDTDTVETDVGAPTFAADVQPIFAQSCASGGCHGGPEALTGLDLSPSVAYDQLVGAPSFQVPTLNLVTAGDPDQSYLMNKLLGSAEDVGGAGDIMPPGFGLGPADIEVVRAWIAAGAPNN
jgi:hypothetical protein